VQINIFKSIARELGMDGYELNIPILSLEDTYNFNRLRLAFSTELKRFSPTFKRIELVDSEDMRAENVNDTMRRAYQAVGG
jgi:hypothetical protein